MTAFSSEETQILSKAIAHRRSMGVARLRPDPVDPALIWNVLEAANWAPSHGETEPWRFTVFTGDSRRRLGEQFAEAYRNDAERDGTFRAETFASQRERGFASPVWISLGVEPAVLSNGELKMTPEEEVMAVACAIQNLHLVASAQGLAGMWLSKGVFRHPNMAKYVGLSDRGVLLGFFVLGYPAIDWPAGERGPIAEKVQWFTE